MDQNHHSPTARAELPQFYNSREVASALNISRTTLYRLVDTRQIPFYRIAGSLRFLKTDIDNYLQSKLIKKVNYESYASPQD